METGQATRLGRKGAGRGGGGGKGNKEQEKERGQFLSSLSLLAAPPARAGK